MKTCFRVCLVVIILFASCKKQNDVVAETLPPDGNGTKETYELMSITFDAIAGAPAEEITDRRPTLHFSNGTSLKQRVVINPDSVFESSTFQQDKDDKIELSNAARLFGVPRTTLNGAISLGPEKWLYKDGESKMPAALKLKDSITVAPGKKLVVALSVIYRQIKARYTMLLKGASSAKTVTVTGSWTGLYPERSQISYRVEDI